MGSLIRLKAEVVNPELPVVTEQGILPYYTGVYVNKLADEGITLTQTEINAITAFIDNLENAGVLDHIDTFYPFMGNVNIPLIGTKALEFSDVSSSNTNLDFVNNKLRGIKGQNSMPNVKFNELTTFNKGIIVGGSMITKTPTSHPSSSGDFLKLLGPNEDAGYPSLQARLQCILSEWRIYIADVVSSEHIVSVPFSPTFADSDVQQNYSFVYGVVNENYRSDTRTYNKTLIKNNVVVTNMASNDAGILLETSDITNYYWGDSVPAYDNKTDRIITTLAFFDEILTAPLSKAFCDALDVFTAAVSKTVSVG